MKCPVAAFLVGLVSVKSVAAGIAPHRSHSTCTLRASGGDDAPAFVSAVLNSTCSTVKIPKGTTLNISSPMDMTGAQDAHIVCV